LNRTVPDTREEECQFWDYPHNMPKASIILVFHNEGWSTLFRTINSVINRSPPQLMHEVVLVRKQNNFMDL
jgi:polypeptide N-acetylgalactosaminyltransferase